MKVKVSVKTSPKVQNKYYEQVIAEAYAEMETMFQENKDLRVSEGHLRDDLACAEARIEKLTAELAQVKKDASQAALATGEILIKADCKAQEQEALIAELNEQITASEADAAFWKGKAEEATAELVKYDIGHYQREIDEWKAIADKLSERLHELQAVFADLQLEHQELCEDYDALVKTKCEYAEYIDTLRQENKRLRNQMPLPEFMRQFIEMTREAVQSEFPDSGNS